MTFKFSGMRNSSQDITLLNCSNMIQISFLSRVFDREQKTFSSPHFKKKLANNLSKWRTKSNKKLFLLEAVVSLKNLQYFLSWYPPLNSFHPLIVSPLFTNSVHKIRKLEGDSQNNIISHSLKLSFSQNDPPMGGSFWKKDSLITTIVFEQWLIMLSSPVANFGNHPLLDFFKLL